VICILLSTFNGAEYLPTLLDSLLAQDALDLRIAVRDDGSTDATVEVVLSWADRHAEVDLTTGPNLGASRSFFELLTSVPDDCRYVAFCDQDDRWEPDKVSRAAEMLSARPPDRPAMYCSRLTIGDRNLTPLSLTPMPDRGPSFANALVENIATGATIMLNRPAVDLVTGHLPDIDALEMYDWWIYLTLSALGEVVFDGESRIVSRQHRRNVVGLPFGVRRLRSKARFITGGDRSSLSAQAGEFHRVFASSLSEEDRRTLETFLEHARRAGPWRRLRYARRGEVYRQRFSDDLLLRIRIALGRV
jgi:glycosyltransferase involved in cell wall biosynthesis